MDGCGGADGYFRLDVVRTTYNVMVIYGKNSEALLMLRSTVGANIVHIDYVSVFVNVSVHGRGLVVTRCMVVR